MFFLDKIGFPLGTLKSVAATLCNYIYTLISYMFDLFVTVSNFPLLDNKDVRPIYQRVTIILAIIMTFYVIFEFVKYVIQPDAMTDKEKGASKIITKLLVVVVLIAFVPNIFSYAFKLQNRIISTNLLSKIILGQYNSSSGNQGGYFASKMFGMFYYFDENLWGDPNLECDGPTCTNVVAMNINSLANGDGMPNITYKLDEAEKLEIPGLEQKNGKPYDELTPKITFKGLWAILVGIFVLYILIMYVIEVGARIIHLAFLQIIAPIPIIGYLSPKKDGIFQKWVKQCVTVYLDVFIRLAIIYFILFICNVILNLNNSNLKFDMVAIVLVLGLLLFAQRAPKLLQELFPKMGSASGNFGLKPGERLKAAGRVVGLGAGAAVGAAAGLGSGVAQGARRWKAARDSGKNGFRQVMAGIGGGAMGAVRGTAGGFVRGAYNGGKKGNVIKNSVSGAKKQIESNKQFGNRQENGYTIGHQISDRARSAFGAKSRTEELESEKVPYDRRTKERKAEQDYQKKQNDDAFNEATTKNKGNSKVRDAVAQYTKINQRFNDLESADSDARKEYRAGQVKHDARSIQGYNDNLKLRDQRLANVDKDAINAIRARISDNDVNVDRDKFKRTTSAVVYDKAAHEAAKADSKYYRDGIFDQQVWERDKANFNKKVSVASYDDAAYKAALNKAKDERAQQLYEQEIESEFRRTVQRFVYADDNEAETARLKELDQLRKDRKSAKDKVQYTYREWALEKEKNADGSYKLDDKGNYIYVDRSRDTTMVRAEEANNQRHVLYNRNASDSQQIDYATEMAAMRQQLAIEEIAKIKGVDLTTLSESQINAFVQANSAEIVAAQNRISIAEVEDQWNKRTVGQDIADSEARIRDLTAQQEKIKDEMSGSGIGEGKK